MMRGRGDVRPDLPDQDRAAMKRRLLVIELAATVLELTDHRLADDPVLTGRRIEAPLMGLGIVEKEQQILDVPAGPVGLEFFELRAAIPNLTRDQSAVVLHPSRGTGKRMLQASDVSLPVTEVEVEIMLSVARGGSRGSRARLRRRVAHRQ